LRERSKAPSITGSAAISHFALPKVLVLLSRVFSALTGCRQRGPNMQKEEKNNTKQQTRHLKACSFTLTF
jgi:predicted small lipoprotein YifL